MIASHKAQDVRKAQERRRPIMTDSTPFDDKQAAFLRIIAEGGTWRKAREELSVGNSTISGWLRDDPEFQEQYARATNVRADAIFEDMIDIADNSQLTPEERRIRIDTRKWAVGKMNRRKYGDKADVEVAGANGGPIAISVKWDDGGDQNPV